MGKGDSSSSRPNMEEAKRTHPHYTNLHLSNLHCSKIIDGGNISITTISTSIIKNQDFSQGLDFWTPIEGHAFIAQSPSGVYAVLTNRSIWWSQLRQNITSNLKPGVPYAFSAIAAVSGSFSGTSEIIASLHLNHHDSSDSYLNLAKVHVVKDEWVSIQGSFMLKCLPRTVGFYLEGPVPGLDLLVKSVVICPTVPSNVPNSNQVFGGKEIKLKEMNTRNIIKNHDFSKGLDCWNPIGGHGYIAESSCGRYAVLAHRTNWWSQLRQNITSSVTTGVRYTFSVVAAVNGNSEVHATLNLEQHNSCNSYLNLARIHVVKDEWGLLEGSFMLDTLPKSVSFYLEGPDPGLNLLVKSVVIRPTASITDQIPTHEDDGLNAVLLESSVVKLAEPTPMLLAPSIEKSAYGVNVIKNSELGKGTDGWISHGGCNLSVENGSPSIMPPLAKLSLGYHKPLSGRYILVKDRLLSSSGPAQIITDTLKLFVTYQVSAWVKIGCGPCGSCGLESVNIALSLDSRWVNLGQVDVTSDNWCEVGGSFRIEEQSLEVTVKVHGPSSGVDLMVAGLRVFAVDREKRFEQLRMEADTIRKRDVVLKFTGDELLGSFVKVKQASSFPIGSCIDRESLENDSCVDFFVKNFTWATFKELKSHGIDEMIKLCQENNIQLRGHCNFWEKESSEKSWTDVLTNDELMAAVQARLELLLTRYKGKFKNFDINNNILYQFGDEIDIANMFKTAQVQDPNTVLFVTDHCTKIVELQKKCAPVGGIGLSGDMDTPVGAVLCSRFDSLGVLGLPIWITGLTLSSANDHVRADDLEVVFREAFAHPSVEGVMLSGFSENSHLVNGEGAVNEAGKRLINIKQEWMSDASGLVDERGEFRFRGFHGSYEVEVVVKGKKATRKFVVDKDDDSTLVLNFEI